jgi:antitoxin component YwqK of YwqJK toxin-antitoxin module
MKTETYKVKIDYYENGQKHYEIWYQNDEFHRLDGPAFQCWFEDGQKQSEAWYKNDKCHRLDGPANQKWYENGQKWYEEWYYFNILHRIGEPAFQSWDVNGYKQHEKIATKQNTVNIDGKEVSEETIINALKNYFK